MLPPLWRNSDKKQKNVHWKKNKLWKFVIAQDKVRAVSVCMGVGVGVEGTGGEASFPSTGLDIVPKKDLIKTRKRTSKLTQAPFLGYMEVVFMSLIDLVNYSGNDEAIFYHCGLYQYQLTIVGTHLQTDNWFLTPSQLRRSYRVQPRMVWSPLIATWRVYRLLQAVTS